MLSYGRLLLSWKAFQLLFFQCSDGALNIEFDAPQQMVKSLRRHIFVDTSLLEVREERGCLSLQGPECLRSRLGEAILDGPGVVPEMMFDSTLQGFSNESSDFWTPSVNMMTWFPGKDVPAFLHVGALKVQASRGNITVGQLNIDSLKGNLTVPKHFSDGLPQSLNLSWTGTWLVNIPDLAKTHSLKAESAAPLLVGLAFAERHRKLQKRVSAIDPISTVQIQGPIGYIRFSDPIVVQLLLARWVSKSKSPALVAGRHALESVWTTHLDPVQLQHGWVNICGDVEQYIDEIVFIGAVGLEIGTLTITALSPFVQAVEPVMMLQPVLNRDRNSKPHFLVYRQNIALAASPFVVTLEEALMLKLRFHDKLSGSSRDVRHDEVAGCFLVSTLSLAQIQGKSLSDSWIRALTNQELFQHTVIPDMLGSIHNSVTSGRSKVSGDGGPLTRRHSELFLRALYDSPGIPPALKNEISNAWTEILDGLGIFVLGLAPHMLKATAILLTNGTASSTSRIKSKLDLVTAAFLHSQ